MENQSRVQGSENKSLVEHMRNKIEELGRCSKGFFDNRSMALQKTYTSVCGCKVHADTVQETTLDAAAGMVKKLLQSVDEVLKEHKRR
ncbi:hypothetical protein Droror1_Dr00012791 [Drosera rotundifolia]